MAAGWTVKATRALVSVWGQESMQSELDGVARNWSIFEKIAREPMAKGFEKTWQQCHAKLKNLTQKYRKVSAVANYNTACYTKMVGAILNTEKIIYIHV